ncbi:MAG: SDR family NAD(P)-dependent oxidoreductase [Desulfobacteraceae bacterium]|nr:SDR family NAD(P)-dependent oxidoreductase [Desulfobacteraceae bacterium]
MIEMKSALLKHPCVEECCVLKREKKTYGKVAIAYVVLSGQCSPDQLESHLQNLLPGDQLPDAYVPVTNLPLTNEGEADEQALAMLEVVDSALIRRWEDELRSVPGIDEAAVIEHEQTKPLPLLHLSDLLPKWKTTGSHPQTDILPDSEIAGTPLAKPGDMAISYGGDLNIPEDAPGTLTEALLRTAAEWKEHGVFYLQTEGSGIFQSYADLLEAAKSILAGLQAKGFRPGDKVILQIEDMKEHYSTFWACVLGGIIPVTVAVSPSFDRNSGLVSKLYNAWRLLGHPSILTHDRLVAPLSELVCDFLKDADASEDPAEKPGVLSAEDLGQYPGIANIHDSKPGDPVFFQLTSGSTGIPKCVQETHAGIIAHIHGSQQVNGYTTDDVILNWLPTDHVVPVLMFHLKDVYLGCRQIHVRTNLILSNPLKWFDLIEAHRVTYTWAPNFGYKLISEQLSKEPGKKWDISSIKSFINGGEQVTWPVIRDFLDRTAEFGVSSSTMKPAFGMAETSTAVVYHKHFEPHTGVYRVLKSSLEEELQKADNDDDVAVTAFVDLGPPIPGVRIRIVDQESHLLPEGIIGRLQIKGQVITPGYYKNDEANEDAFEGDGWFDSGDLGFILNGRLCLTGRGKEMIVVRGANFYCHEIEDVINHIEGVEPTFSAACSVDDSETESEVLAIFFVPKAPDLKDHVRVIREIRTEVATNLGITPELVIPVAKEEFPKTTSGKIQRVQLKKSVETGKYADLLKKTDLALENENTLPDWFYEQVWQRKEAVIIEEQQARGTTLVFMDRLGLGDMVCDKPEFADHVGVTAGPVFARLEPRLFQLNPAEPDHYTKLVSSLAGDNIIIRQVLHMWTYDEYPGEISGVEMLDSAQYLGVYSLLFLTQALSRIRGEQQAIRMLVVSSHTWYVTDDDRIAPEKTTIHGIIRTIPQELPWMDCCHLDLPMDEPGVNADMILREIRAVSKDRSVAYRCGRRFIPCLKKADMKASDVQLLPFRQKGMYLLTGGLGGIGARIARYLLENYQARLLLTGRSPQSVYMREYRKLEKIGGEILYKPVDTADLNSMQRIVKEAQDLWNCELDGVIHLAGHFHTRLLKDETRESFAAALQPKLSGTWVIHQLIKGNPRAVFIGFSSLNAFFGGYMVGAYSAANAFLEQFSAFQRRLYSMESHCFGWSTWSDLGINRGNPMNDRLRTMGYCVIEPRQGICSWLAGMHMNRPGLIIGLDKNKSNVQRYVANPVNCVRKLTACLTSRTDPLPLEKLQTLQIKDCFGTLSSCDFQQIHEIPRTSDGEVDNQRLLELVNREAMPASEYAEPENEAERMIAEIWKDALSADRVGIHNNFFELGGNSLLMAQVKSGLEKVFKLQISDVDMFRYPTISSLARHLTHGTKERTRVRNKFEKKRQKTGDIAVIGMACRFPGARNTEEFWLNLCDGRESLTFFSDDELRESGVNPDLLQNSDYVKSAPILDHAEMFDAAFFGCSPQEARNMDPQHRLFLETAWETLEHAGYDPETYNGSVGVFGGAATNAHGLFLQPRPGLDMNFVSYLIGTDKDFLISRVSYKLNLKGPGINVQTACSTALVALHMASASLMNHESDMALAGAVSVRIPHKAGHLYEEGGIFSRDGHCRAFDADATGMVFGNGVGMVLLKPLGRAIADRDTIHAVIKGSAINNDGSLKAGYTAPSVDGQARVIHSAMACAGMEPGSISYIEAHGTGTAIGDPIEIAALTEAFEPRNSGEKACAIGSVKTNIGHLDAAAGIAGLIKTILMLRHKTLVPSLNFQRPNPRIDFAHSPFYVNTKRSQWRTDGSPRRAGVSAFGFGGTNAHVILEEAPDHGQSDPSGPWQLLVLSAKTRTALDKAGRNLAQYLKQYPYISLADVAYTLKLGRQAFDYRQMLVCRDIEDAVKVLSDTDSERLVKSTEKPGNPSVAFMFSGQGSQYVDMGLEIYRTEPFFAEQADRCCELARPRLGMDLREILYPEEGQRETAADKLKQTAITQPALFVVEYALARLWMKWGIIPDAMVGHSIGEYVAACLSGVMSPEEALPLVAFRGRLLQHLPAGSMMAVSMAEHEIQPLLGRCSLAAVNSPGQTVVSGSRADVEKLEVQLKKKGFACQRLKTSHAYHSHMLDPILAEFRNEIQKVRLNPPSIPFVSNVTGTWISQEEATDPDYWVSHLRQTVRFADCMETLLEDERRVLLETGPGRTLSELAKKQVKYAGNRVVLTSMRHPKVVQSDRAFLLNTLGRLYLANASVDWPEFYSHEKRRRIPLPTYPFEHRHYWTETKQSPGKVADALPSDADKNTEISEWFYMPSWKQLPISPSVKQAVKHGHGRNRWLVFADESGLGLQAARELEHRGQDVIIVKPGNRFEKRDDRLYTINSGYPGDYEALIEELGAADNKPGKIIHLRSIAADADPDTYAIHEAMDHGFYSLLFLAQAIGKQEWTHPIQISVVSDKTREVTGNEVIYPEKATIVALCKVIPQEFPNITCRYTDIELPETGEPNQLVSDQLVSEVMSTSSETMVAWRGRYRWVRTFEPFPVEKIPGSASRLRHEGVYLITGGLGGLGMVLAKYLAENYKARLILTSRRGLPPREEWEQILEKARAGDGVSDKISHIRSLEASGAEIMVLAADVADLQQMQQVMGRIRKQFRHLHGVIHAAGIVSEESFRTIRKADPEHCEDHFRSKISGLMTLERVVPKDIDFCLLCSSLSSILGGLGLSAYAAGNMFMDAFVHQHNKTSSTPWLSVNWDGWLLEHAGIRGGSSLGNMLFNVDISPKARLTMLPREGTDVFERVLTIGNAAQAVISTGDLQTRLDKWIRLDFLREHEAYPEEKTSSLVSRPDLSTEYAGPRNDLEENVVRIWQDLLGTEQIGIHDNFFELGGDSLLSIKLNIRLKKALGVGFSVHNLFNTPTVAQFTESLGDAGTRAIIKEKQEISEIRPGQSEPSEPGTILEHQFAVSSQASDSEKKQHMKQFYDNITRQLNSSEFGEFSAFLNYGYIASDNPQYSDKELPEYLMNRNSVKLVLEVIGDFDIRPDSEILDVGCGRGGTISVIHQFFKPGKVTGLDLSSDAIKFCRENYNWPDTLFMEGDAENLPFDDQSFDAVINVESSHSYPNIHAFYKQVYRVLKPGGFFLYTDLFPGEMLENCLNLLRESGFSIARDQDITGNVLLSCDDVAETHYKTFIRNNDPRVMADFLALPGSKTYNDMKLGNSTYRIFKLGK